MSGIQFWYGYLDAGAQSSPVAIDPRLDTGNPKTRLIFNLARAEILEYSREIVTPKLRELQAEEASSLLPELRSAYKRARSSFVEKRVRREVYRPEPAGAAGKGKGRPEPEEIPDLDTDDLDDDSEED